MKPKPKEKITRRKPGLVIKPPPIRPVGDDHPARLIFKEALAAERAAESNQSGGEARPAPDTKPVHLQELVSAKEPLHDISVDVEPSSDTEAFSVTEELVSEAEIIDKREVIETGEAVKNQLSPLDVALKPALVTPISQHINESEESKRSDFSAREDTAPNQIQITWEEFEASFKKRVSKSQLKICKVLFDKTYALGLESCLVRTRDLMEMSGVKGRTMYYALSELENAGFIKRGVVYNTPTKKGQVVSFYPTPQLKRSESERSFHYYDPAE
jgi:hypothetical protein